MFGALSIVNWHESFLNSLKAEREREKGCRWRCISNWESLSALYQTSSHYVCILSYYVEGQPPTPPSRGSAPGPLSIWSVIAIPHPSLPSSPLPHMIIVERVVWRFRLLIYQFFLIFLYDIDKVGRIILCVEVELRFHFYLPTNPSSLSPSSLVDSLWMCLLFWIIISLDPAFCNGQHTLEK